MLNILPLFRNVFDFTTVSSTIHSSQQQLPALFAHLPAPKRLRHQLLNPDYLSLPPIPSPILISRDFSSRPPLTSSFVPPLPATSRNGLPTGWKGRQRAGRKGVWRVLPFINRVVLVARLWSKRFLKPSQGRISPPSQVRLARSIRYYKVSKQWAQTESVSFPSPDLIWSFVM